MNPPTTDQETSAKTDYVWEVLSNYESFYLEAVRLAKYCASHHFTPKRSGQVFQGTFYELAHSYDYRVYTRGTPGRLDWTWIATTFIEGIIEFNQLEKSKE